MNSFLDEQYSNTVHFRLLALEHALKFAKDSPDYYSAADILDIAKAFEVYIFTGEMQNGIVSE